MILVDFPNLGTMLTMKSDKYYVYKYYMYIENHKKEIIRLCEGCCSLILMMFFFLSKSLKNFE